MPYYPLTAKKADFQPRRMSSCTAIGAARKRWRPSFPARPGRGAALARALWAALLAAAPLGSEASTPRAEVAFPLIATQLPLGTDAEAGGARAGGMLPADYGERARLVLIRPDRTTRVLTEGWHGACGADVSFDGTRILFAGRKTAADAWQIYEMNADGSQVRQITQGRANSRSPVYQSAFFTLDSPKPWHQLTFVGDAAGTQNECSPVPATHLYSCRLDGSEVQRLTYNLSSDAAPALLPDGRLVYAGWQRAAPERGERGRVALSGINLDGTDAAAFSADEGRRIKSMPCATREACVFVESDGPLPWDGAGRLAAVSLRRPLHSHRRLTSRRDGLFHSPAPLPDGRILVSRRPANGSGSHGLGILDPASGRFAPLFDDPAFHEIHARAICARPEPDGRSSVVNETDPHGKLYCLDVRITDRGGPGGESGADGLKVRVLEGLPAAAAPGDLSQGSPRLARKRLLGDVAVDPDGSFNIEVPANVPIQLQLVDGSGTALRTCGWIWARNHEPRGCIGCHEDGERTPPNRMAAGLLRPSVVLEPPEQERRTGE